MDARELCGRWSAFGNMHSGMKARTKDSPYTSLAGPHPPSISHAGLAAKAGNANQ